jgi:hypothetical protein
MTAKYSITFIVFFVLVIFGCGTSQMDPVVNDVPKQLASAKGSAVVSTAAAQTSISNSFFPVDILQFVPCANGGAGETVELTGIVHDQVRVTINGHKIGIKTHDNPQGVTGVGLTSGDKYQGTGVTQDIINTTFTGFPYIETFTNNFRIIGQGHVGSYLLHENFHVTVLANGTVAVVVDNLSLVCK